MKALFSKAFVRYTLRYCVTFTARDRVRFALATVMVMLNTYECGNLQSTIGWAYLVLEWLCPYKRYEELFRGEIDTAKDLWASAVDVAKKLAQRFGTARDAALGKPSHRP